MHLKGIHHIAIICSNYPVSKKFYTQILGLTVLNEVYRNEKQSWKLDLALNNEYIIELFSFPSPPSRSSYPEATGLRHLAFACEDLYEVKTHLDTFGVVSEPFRVDEHTGKLFFFIADPDGLPIEFYQV